MALLLSRTSPWNNPGRDGPTRSMCREACEAFEVSRRFLARWREGRHETARAVTEAETEETEALGVGAFL